MMSRLVFLFMLISFSIHAEVVNVKQELLEKTLSCTMESKKICFDNAEYYPKYNLYIFNFKAKAEKESLKNRTIREYVDDTLGPSLAFLNPKAAEFYNIDPILNHLIDESLYSSENIVLGLNVTYGEEVYTSFIRIREDDSLFLESSTEIIDIKPSELIINRCENMKKLSEEFTNKMKEDYCDFGSTSIKYN